LLLSNGTFAPTTFGDQNQTSFNGQQYYYPNQGVQLSGAFASYGAVYKGQVWIHTLVNKIAYGTARLPLKVYARGSDDSRTPARDTPFALLLRNPNPATTRSSSGCGRSPRSRSTARPCGSRSAPGPVRLLPSCGRCIRRT
jgi:hypothetical protein